MRETSKNNQNSMGAPLSNAINHLSVEYMPLSSCKLKLAKVIQINKNGDELDPSNYMNQTRS